MNQLKKLFGSRRFKYGSIATLLTVIFIAAVVIFNIVAIMLVDRLPVKVDLTDNNLFEITQETIDFLSTVEDDITITLTADEEEFTSYGLEYESVNETIKQFAMRGKSIDVQYVDLLSNPDFAADYENLSSYSIIVESQKRYRILAMSDMFNVTYDDYGQLESVDSSKAEQELDSAIMFVTDQNPETIMIIGGRDEYSMDAFETLLEQNSYVLKDVNILSEELDPEADFAFIAAPQYDYTEDMIDKLDTWLDNGGQFGKTLLYSTNADQRELPVLEAYLEEWGIDIGREIIAETDDNNVYMSRYYCVQQIASDLYTDGLNSPSNPILIANSRPINVLWDGKGIREVEPLVTTYDTAVLRPENADEDWTVAEATEGGVYNSIVLSRKLNYDITPSTQSNVVVFGSLAMFDETFLTMQGLNNGDYLISMLNGISGREDTMVIAPKSFDSPALSLTAEQAKVMSWLFIGIVPGIVIAMGIITWLRRRHL